MGPDALANRVNVLFEDRRGRIWAGTDAGIWRLDREASASASTAATTDCAGFRPIPLDIHPGSIGAGAIAEDRDGVLWFGLNEGLLRYAPDGRRVQFTIRPTFRGDGVHHLLFDRDGRLWIGHLTGLIVMPPPSDADGTRTGPVPARPLLPRQAHDDDLAPREIRLLKLFAEGYSYQAAAAELSSAVNTVAFHVRNIYRKLEVHSSSEAVAKALRAGLI